MQAPNGAISLAQAARLSGYHQDYLGQLCRAGKLSATKMGRTWFTTEASVRKFLSSLQGEARMDFSEQENVHHVELSGVRNSMDAVRPQIKENYVVSEVVGLPIAIKTQPAVPRTASLDGVIMKVRLQQVQRDLTELTQTVHELATAIAQNSEKIENLQTTGTAATFKHNYVPSLEAVTTAPVRRPKTIAIVEEETPYQLNFRQQFFIVSGSLIALALAFLFATNINWQDRFLGSNTPVATTIQYQTSPRVAGDSVVLPSNAPTAKVINSNSNISKTLIPPATPAESLGGANAGQIIQ